MHEKELGEHYLPPPPSCNMVYLNAERSLTLSQFKYNLLVVYKLKVYFKV